MVVGDKFMAHVPVQISEDKEWPVGTVVELVQLRPPDGFELQTDDGSIGSFARIDLEGEHAWFHPLDAKPQR
jgi:hypothetical protein